MTTTKQLQRFAQFVRSAKQEVKNCPNCNADLTREDFPCPDCGERTGSLALCAGCHWLHCQVCEVRIIKVPASIARPIVTLIRAQSPIVKRYQKHMSTTWSGID